MNPCSICSGISEVDSVIECRSFDSADAKYRALIAVSEKEGWPHSSNQLSQYTAPRVLSLIESEIFMIERSEVAALFWAYERYESLIGRESTVFGEFTDQERVNHAKFFRHECNWSFDGAVGFMIEVCDLRGPKCLGWVCKIVAMNIRGYLYRG